MSKSGDDDMRNAEPPQRPPRAWQRMLSGRRLDLLAPAPEDIEIGDIAHGLARVARWNGQTRGAHAFSVAQHSLVVERLAAALAPGLGHEGRLAALLHDAPEYVIGDLISPFKAAVGLSYRRFEARLLEAIYDRFGISRPLPGELAALLKRADRVAAYYEATVLAGFTEDEARVYFGQPDGLPADMAAELERLHPLPAAEAQAQFLARYAALAGTGSLAHTR